MHRFRLLSPRVARSVVHVRTRQPAVRVLNVLPALALLFCCASPAAGQGSPDPPPGLNTILPHHPALQIGGQWWVHTNYAAFDGRRPGHAGEQNFLDLFAILDMDKLIGCEGGRWSAVYQNHAGTNGHTLAGDEQFFDQIDASPNPQRSQLSALWYEQKLLDDRVRIKIGKVDANNEFAMVNNAMDFLHGAFGNAPTIFLLPTYPDPACGVNLFLNPTKSTHIGLAMYDGSAAYGHSPGRAGPGRLLSGKAPLFWIGEAGYTYELAGGRDGRFVVGGWWSTATFEEVDELRQETVDVLGNPIIVNFGRAQPIHGVGGSYVVWEQTLWRENPDDPDDLQGIRAFYQFGNSNPHVTIFQFYNGAGFTWSGFADGRDEDSIGFGVACSDLSSDPQAVNFRRGRIRNSDMRGSETALNSYYMWKHSPNLTISPNTTYIIPAAQSAKYGSPLMLTLRILLSF